jgi:hypothetical protein
MRCANGHDSAATDYCDTCGIRIGAPASSDPVPSGTPTPSGAGPSAAAPGTVAPDVAGDDCPNCGASRVAGERFCEVCGLDFDTGRLPQAPTPTPAAAADPAPVGAAPPPAPPAAGIGWVAVVRCDRQWWEHNAGAGGVADGVPYPDPEPAPRRVVLTASRVVIGRTSGSSVADVDCGSADTGVSRRHAQLTRNDDGTWSVADLGSTNGTFLDGRTDRLEPQAPTPFDPAGSLRIGAYTVVRIEPGTA